VRTRRVTAIMQIEFVLFAFLIATAFTVVVVRDLFAAAMLFGIFSLLSSGMMLMMDAVDVSFTEAAVGAGVSTVLILSALSLTDASEKRSTENQWTAKLVVVTTGALLIFGTFDMPYYGDPDAPIHNHVAPDYIEGSRTDLEIPNIVTSVLASYRGFDTFGETTVVWTALIGAMLLLGGSRKDKDEAPEMPDKPEAL
jgi:multicomponent Na+:H+ antiporter subunit B